MCIILPLRYNYFLVMANKIKESYQLQEKVLE